MTWAEIVKIEPRLAELYKEIRTIKDDKSKPYFCANEIWYAEFKPEIKYLVGWFAEKEELRGSDTWDLAYQKLYRTLPACRKCSCL